MTIFGRHLVRERPHDSWDFVFVVTYCTPDTMENPSVKPVFCPYFRITTVLEIPDGATERNRQNVIFLPVRPRLKNEFLVRAE